MFAKLYKCLQNHVIYEELKQNKLLSITDLDTVNKLYF